MTQRHSTTNSRLPKREMQSWSRRQTLKALSLGFGWTAFQGLQKPTAALAGPLPAFQPKAKSVIFLYMSGGVSHVDTFDPKPRLRTEHGKPMPVRIERTQFNNNGSIFGSPFDFKRYGQSGIEVSDLFPYVGKVADELMVIRSMTSKVNEHAQGNFFVHTGFPFVGYPSAGAWMVYGLGTENENLPGYVVLQSGRAGTPHGGVGLFGSGFLPATTEGAIFKSDNPETATANLKPSSPAWAQQRRLAFMEESDRQYVNRIGGSQDVDSAIQNYETAFRMQAAVPEVCDMSDETEATRKLYGMESGDSQTAAYGRQCLLARRLVERGVRFIELSCLPQNAGDGQVANPWDQHGGLETGHGNMARQVDQPISGLIQDLKARGLLDETLIIWAGEFGRTPFSQGGAGRDHNPFGFSVWMAGGGVRGGTVYGATDDLGYHVAENPVSVYELWATVQHLMGLDFQKLTYRHGGRDFRLTDVHGRVMHDWLA